MAHQPSAGPAFWLELRNDLSEKLSIIRKDEHQPVLRAKKGIQLSREALAQLLESVRISPLTTVTEQITFFKDTEPFFLGHLIFYSRLQTLETGRPPGNRSTIETHFQKEWQYIRDFHAEHHFLYRYIRAGETWLDDKLFISPHGRLTSQPDPPSLQQFDPLLHDAPSTVASIVALDQMQDYLLTAEEELRQPTDRAQRNIPRLTWTDSKAALIELAYAFQSAGSLNDRKAELREVIDCLQTAFHIDLGHYPRVFQEILSRKSGYTNYIDRLRDKLLLRIKLIEEKYDR